jgi:hypothetical protein
MATLSVGGQLVATNDTLSNGVQDNITRLGTVTSGTLGVVAKGTVTESGGTPTGAVLELSSNSNGHYCKYADGTLICTIQDITSSSGSTITWTFPHSFKSSTEPSVIGTSGDSTSRVDVGGGGGSISNTSWGFFCYSLDNNVPARSTSNQNLSAIGRWY